MARVLLYTSPGPGHVYPPIATLLALRERGHDVAVRTGTRSVEPLERLGLKVAAVDPCIEAVQVDDWKTGNPIGQTKRLFEAFAQRAEYEIPDLQAAVRAERPDLIWVDINCLAASAAAEASGLPWAHYLPYPHPLPARGVPAYGPGFAPSTSAPAHLRDTALNGFRHIAFRSVVRPFNLWRRRLGLPAFDHGEDFFLSAPLLIQFSAEPFEYPRRWPVNVRLVGPALWEPPAAEPQWLADEVRQILLVTASTEFQDDAELIKVTLAAFADRPYAVIATTAAHDPSDFRVPANARVERFLPHGPILRRAAVVISHGGMGTTQKALAAGVPVCVVPFMRDQFEVARRVEHCSAGTILPAKRLRPDRLLAAVEKAVVCRKGAEGVRDAFGKAGGAEAAASALETLIPSPAGSPKVRSGRG